MAESNGNGHEVATPVAVEVKEHNEVVAAESQQFRAEGAPELGFWGPDNTGPFGDQYEVLRLSVKPDDLPEWGTRARDRFLRHMLHQGTLISGIIYQEVTRVKNMPFVIKSLNENSSARWVRLLNEANFGKGFRDFVNAVALDLLTQDNGAFIEIIGDGGSDTLEGKEFNMRVTKPLDGAVLGVASMDAANCWRTFDPEYPVMYMNPYPVGGKKYYVLFHKSRVHAMSQFTQNNELARGIGICALSRMFEAWRLIHDMNTYKHEKIAGIGPELKLIRGIPTSTLKRIRFEQEQQRDNKEFARFGSSMLVGVPGGMNAPDVNVVTVGVKSVPDGFDYEEDMTQNVLQLAAAGGLDLREIGWPGLMSGATRADAEISDIKSEGKGRADVMKDIEDFFNMRVMPAHKIFEFRPNNPLSEKRHSENAQRRADTRAIQLLSGEITIQEARIMAAESGDIPAEFLTTDIETINEGEEEMNVQRMAEESQPTMDENIQNKTFSSKDYHGEIRPFFVARAELLMERASNKDITRPNFMAQFRSLILNEGMSAYIQGVSDGGAPGIESAADLEDNERSEALGLIRQAQGFVRQVANFAFVEDLDISRITDRAGLWANKTLDGIYTSGLMAGAANKNMEWILGPTEHCDSCMGASQQIHRAKTWKKSGIFPRSDILDCGGYKCQCELKESKERARGSIGSIPGAKDHA